jgi:hypothetical protein
VIVQIPGCVSATIGEDNFPPPNVPAVRRIDDLSSTIHKTSDLNCRNLKENGRFKKFEEQRAVRAFVPTSLWSICGRSINAGPRDGQPVGDLKAATRVPKNSTGQSRRKVSKPDRPSLRLSLR